MDKNKFGDSQKMTTDTEDLDTAVVNIRIPIHQLFNRLLPLFTSCIGMG